MENQSTYNTATGFFCGILGGFFHYLQIGSDIEYIHRLIEAGVTALICGAAGVIGKEIVVWVKNKFFKKK